MVNQSFTQSPDSLMGIAPRLFTGKRPGIASKQGARFAVANDLSVGPRFSAAPTLEAKGIIGYITTKYVITWPIGDLLTDDHALLPMQISRWIRWKNCPRRLE